MQKILFFFLLVFVFFGSFFAAKRVSSHPVVKEEKSSSFAPTAFPLKNQSFVIVVIGANNGAFVTKTLASVFSQNYDAYRVIYIDDASTDGSFDVARDFLYDHNERTQVTLVQNETPLGTLANIARAVETLEDQEIVVILQGEDWLAHEWVLQRLNAYYANPDLWIAYGKYKNFPSYETGECIEEAHPRNGSFSPLCLNTFYAALFKQIKESDFLCGGQFLSSCAEMAYMAPMLEMAKGHSFYIPEVLYIHNEETLPKENREAKLRAEKFIRGLDRYSPITSLWREPCGD